MKKYGLGYKSGIRIFLVIALTVGMLWGCGKTAEPADADRVEVEIEPISDIAESDRDITASSAGTDIDTEKKEASDDIAAMQVTPSPEPTKELTVDMTKVTAIDPAVKMYAVSNINIRKGPSTDYEAVGMLKLGESIDAIGRDADGWYEFMYNDEEAFASDDYLSIEEPVLPTPVAEAEGSAGAKEGEDTAAAETAAAQTAAIATAAAANVQAPAGVIIIGDSRSVMMRDATGGGGCSWICQNAKGYNWLESTAIPQADASIGKGTKVVIALGVNDVGNVNKYAALVNAKAAEWAARGAKTYYVSVNPVWENAYVTEEQVQFFNSQLLSQLVGIKWIDTHSYLMNSGYRLTDGLHFDNETSIRIFQTIIASL